MALRVHKDNFEELVVNSALPVLVDFYSSSCVVCKKLSPALSRLEEEYEGRLTVVKVNTDFDTEIAGQYRVSANPTLLFLKKGEVVGSRVGVGKPAEIKEWIEKLLQRG
jgi:thioredoxin 1